MSDDSFVPPLPALLPIQQENPFKEHEGIEATEKEAAFIKHYTDLRNSGSSSPGTTAAKMAYDCKNSSSARVIAGRLIKKFGLKKPNRTVMPEVGFDAHGYDPKRQEAMGIAQEKETPVPEPAEKAGTEAPIPESKIKNGGMSGRIQTLTEALNTGELSFRDLFNEMRSIAYCYRDKAVSIRALVQLKEWWDEAKKQRDTMEMSERDVVDVMSCALSSVSRAHYIEILKVCRERRKQLIRERNRVIDVEAIVKDEQSKKIWSEENAPQFDEVPAEEEDDV